MHTSPISIVISPKHAPVCRRQTEASGCAYLQFALCSWRHIPLSVIVMAIVFGVVLLCFLFIHPVLLILPLVIVSLPFFWFCFPGAAPVGGVARHSPSASTMNDVQRISDGQ